MSVHRRLADGFAGLLPQPRLEFLQRGIRLLIDQLPQQGSALFVQGRLASAAAWPGSQRRAFSSSPQQLADERLAHTKAFGGVYACFLSFVTGPRHPLPQVQ
jgi:hypothetical protein